LNLKKRWIELLGRMVFAICCTCTLTVMGMGQQPATAKTGTPKETIKAFPPARNAEFAQAQMELELAKARVVQAEQRIRLLLYAVADEIELTKTEREICPFALDPNGAWVFRCPPADKAAEKPKKPPESATKKQ
jgi:hypothetical protein